MDDLQSFERRLAGELAHMAGPEPRVDAMAVARAVAARAPKRRTQRMVSPLSILAGGVYGLKYLEEGSFGGAFRAILARG